MRSSGAGGLTSPKAGQGVAWRHARGVRAQGAPTGGGGRSGGVACKYRMHDGVSGAAERWKARGFFSAFDGRGVAGRHAAVAGRRGRMGVEAVAMCAKWEQHACGART